MSKNIFYFQMSPFKYRSETCLQPQVKKDGPWTIIFFYNKTNIFQKNVLCFCCFLVRLQAHKRFATALFLSHFQLLFVLFSSRAFRQTIKLREMVYFEKENDSSSKFFSLWLIFLSEKIKPKIIIKSQLSLPNTFSVFL